MSQKAKASESVAQAPATASAVVQEKPEVLESSVKLAGEAFVAPGSSLILDGDLVAGGAHLVGGMVAKWAFGPVGWFLVAANSYSKSVTGTELVGHVKQAFQGKKEAQAAAPQIAASEQAN